MKTTRLFSLLFSLMLVASSCSLLESDEESADDVSAEATTTVAPATTEAPETTEAPDTTEAPAGGGAGTLDDPRSVLGATFEYSEEFYDTDWAGELYGMLSLPTNSSDPGVCYGLVGVISPVRIGEGSISEGFTAPNLGLVVDGVLVDDSFGCDTDDVRDAGYGPLFDAQVTEGTEFAFYATFFVEGDAPSAPTALVLGDTNDPLNVTYFTTDTLDAIPVPVVEAGSGTGGDTQPLIGASFSYRGQFDDTTWDVQLFGLLEGEKDSFVDQAGSCLVLLGTVTPTQIDIGQVSEGFDAPDFAAVAGGVQIEDESDCEVEDIEVAGYGRLWDAEATLGTVYPFHVGFFIPEGSAAESIIAGDPTEDGGAQFYSVDTIPALPPADTSASLGTLPEGMTPLNGSAFTYTDGFSETSWEAIIDGMVATEVDSFADIPGRCFAVLGVITPTEIGEGAAITDGFDTPNIGLIAGGVSVQWNSFFCEDDLLKANGYDDLSSAEVAVGTEYPYYVQFFVPGDESVSLDSVFIGDASDEGALYYDAPLLDAIPNRN